MIWTICFLLKENKVCLAMKKRGHGVGRWNGTGGKPKEGENLEDTAKRETLEETGVELLNLIKVADIEFKDLPSQTSHFATAYISTKWRGKLKETEEMKPQWFEKEKIPYNQMWSADRMWIPEILKGKKIKAVFEYSEGDALANSTIVEL